MDPSRAKIGMALFLWLVFPLLVLSLGSIIIYHDENLDAIAVVKPHVVFTSDTLDHIQALKMFKCTGFQKNLLCVPKSLSTWQIKPGTIKWAGILWTLDPSIDLDKNEKAVRWDKKMQSKGVKILKTEKNWTNISSPLKLASPMAKMLPFEGELALRSITLLSLLALAYGSWYWSLGIRPRRSFIF